MATIQDHTVNYAKFMVNDYSKEITKKITVAQAALVTALAVLAQSVAPVTALVVGTLTLVAHSIYKFERARRSPEEKAADGLDSFANSVFLFLLGILIMTLLTTTKVN